MAMAKREAARRGLYAMFFRGPILGPEEDEELAQELASKSELVSTTSGDGIKRKRKSDPGKEASREEKRLRRDARKARKEEKIAKFKEKSSEKQKEKDRELSEEHSPRLSAPEGEEPPKRKKKRSREGGLKEEDEAVRKKKEAQKVEGYNIAFVPLYKLLYTSFDSVRDKYPLVHSFSPLGNKEKKTHMVYMVEEIENITGTQRKPLQALCMVIRRA